MSNKTFALKALTLAVATVLPALASAQTSVRLYGLLDGYVGTEKNLVGSKTVVNSGGMSTSFWGVGGEEDLGAGMKAVFALEGFLRVDGGEPGRFNGDAFFARSAYVGLSGGSGTVTLGRNTTPFFLSTIIFNPFGDSFDLSPAFRHQFVGNVQGDTGFKNSIRYQSPMMGGFKLDALYTLGDENDSNNPLKKRNKGFDLAGFYFGGPLSATMVYRDLNLDNTGVTADQKSFLAGVAYDLKALKVFGQLGQSKLTSSASGETKDRMLQLGVSVPMGAGAILASIADDKITDNNAATASKRRGIAVGYDHNLSKRTDLYAVVFDDKFSNPESDKLRRLALGIRHRF